MSHEWVYKILKDIDDIDFKNCKKDCYKMNYKYIKECSLYYYKHKEEFSFNSLMEELK